MQQPMRNNAWLVYQLAKREVALKYKGSVFGVAWSLINPLIMLAVYAFVFSVVLRARWPGVAEERGGAAYVVFLLSGLVVHGFLAECVTKAPGQIIGNVNFVKKIVFPLPAIAVAQWLAALFHLSISLFVLLVFQVGVFGIPPVTALLAPVALVPIAFFGLGMMWALSALTVYFRDIGQMVSVFATLLLFLSTALFPMENVPAEFRPFLYLNPLTPAIECFRDLAIRGHIPGPSLLGLYGVSGVAGIAGGWFCFKRLQRGFADVL
jgi:lipopolysaccharide transport system permease protein